MSKFRTCYKDQEEARETQFNKFSDGKERLNITREAGWQYVMIVRDPIERFLSGYLFMCI